jgi:ribosomal protein L29
VCCCRGFDQCVRTHAARVKAHELRNKSKQDLKNQVSQSGSSSSSSSSSSAGLRSSRTVCQLLLRVHGATVACACARPLADVSLVLCVVTHHNITHAQLNDLKQELSSLRVAKVTGGAPNKLSKM